MNKSTLDAARCIQCGACIRICDHEARSYTDDTEEFFSQLKKGRKISLLVAPAIRNTIPQYKNLFGYLKKLGVNLIYDVSFGADITTWAYLKAAQELKISTMIAQPCPVIVSYIQKYEPRLIPFLAPIHSPTLCAAIYLRKVKNIGNELAFLSPCIGKTTEFGDENTGGNVKYNVTVSKLRKYLKEQSVNLAAYPAVSFDDRPCDLGFAFSRPGGLRENVEYYTGGKGWVNQVEGIKEDCEYLEKYLSRVLKHKKTPLLVDILNCKHGCNIGTGMDFEAELDDIDYRINEQKNKFTAAFPEAQESQLFKAFEQSLVLSDYVRKYSDESHQITNAPEDAVEKVFIQLGKTTPESRNINCFACGYGSCRKFATAVANGNNDVSNCINYSRMKLKSGREEFNALFQSLEEQIRNINAGLDSINGTSNGLNSIAMQTKIIAMNARIESARAGQFGRSFAVVAAEIKELAEKSEEFIKMNQVNQNHIVKDIENFEEVVDGIKDKIDRTLQ
jgi:iron only hydrogenase large subunit-like protein